MKTENYCRCSKCIEQEEETTPAPTPWEVKEGYWYEQYQLMRERYNRQIGENSQQAERIRELEEQWKVPAIHGKAKPSTEKLSGWK